MIVCLWGASLVHGNQITEDVSDATVTSPTANISSLETVINTIRNNYPNINLDYIKNGLLTKVNHKVTKKILFAQLGIVFNYEKLFDKLFEIKNILNTILLQVFDFVDNATVKWEKGSALGDMNPKERSDFCQKVYTETDTATAFYITECSKVATNLFLKVFEIDVTTSVDQYVSRNDMLTNQLTNIRLAYALHKFIGVGEITTENPIITPTIDDTIDDSELQFSSDTDLNNQDQQPTVPDEGASSESTIVSNSPHIIATNDVDGDSAINEPPTTIINSNDHTILIDSDNTVPTLSPTIDVNLVNTDNDRRKRSVTVPDVPQPEIPTQSPKLPGALSFLTNFYSDAVDLATLAQLNDVHAALSQLQSVDYDLTLWAHDTVAVLISHQAQLKLITTSIIDLNYLAKESAMQLRDEFELQIAPEMQEANFKLTYLNSILLRISVLQNDVQNEISRLSIGVRHALQGIITPEAIAPTKLFSALQTFGNSFNDFEFMWDLKDINTIDKVYKNAHTYYTELEQGTGTLLVINIPIIQQNLLGRHVTIHALPFRFQNKGSQLKFKLSPENPDSIDILQFGNDIYEISPQDLDSNPFESIDTIRVKTLKHVDPEYHECIMAILTNTLVIDNSMDLFNVNRNCAVQSNYSPMKITRPHPNILLYFSSKPTRMETQCLSKVARNTFNITNQMIDGLGITLLGPSCQISTAEHLILADPTTIAESNSVWESDIVNVAIPNATADFDLVVGIMRNVNNISKEVLRDLYNSIELNLPSFINLNSTQKLVSNMQDKLRELDNENAFTSVIIKLMTRPTAISLTFLCIIFTISLVAITFILYKIGFFKCLNRIFAKCFCPNHSKLIKYENQEDIQDMEILFRHASEILNDQMAAAYEEH